MKAISIVVIMFVYNVVIPVVNRVIGEVCMREQVIFAVASICICIYFVGRKQKSLKTPDLDR